MQFYLKEDQEARWQASLAKFDIGFELLFQPGAEVRPAEHSGEMLQKGTIGDANDSDQGGYAKGCFTAPCDGCLKLVLDNSYSRMRSKECSYFLGLEERAKFFESQNPSAQTGPGVLEVKEKQTLFANTEAEGLAFVKALQTMSGSADELAAASDDEGEGDTGLSLRKMAGRLTDELASTGVTTGADGRLLPPRDHEIDITCKARTGGSGCKQEVAMRMEEGDEVHWLLQLERYDIKWSAMFQPEGQISANQVGPSPPQQIFEVADLVEIDAGVGHAEGQYTAPYAGELILVLDNSYSKMRKKFVRCGLYAVKDVPLPTCAYIPRKGKGGFQVKHGSQ